MYVTYEDLLNFGLLPTEETGSERNSIALWFADLGPIKFAEQCVGEMRRMLVGTETLLGYNNDHPGQEDWNESIAWLLLGDVLHAIEDHLTVDIDCFPRVP